MFLTQVLNLLNLVLQKLTTLQMIQKSSLRIIEGSLVIMVSFIFIVQSATAIDLWLNFAAVQFVGCLDDTAFCE